MTKILSFPPRRATNSPPEHLWRAIFDQEPKIASNLDQLRDRLLIVNGYLEKTLEELAETHSPSSLIGDAG
jgi:hypothetical protein